MKCYKCGEEMTPISDTTWRKHTDGTKVRATEFMCAECRVFMELQAMEFSECINLEGDE